MKPKSRNACGFYVTFRESDNAFMGVYDYDENEMPFDNSQTPPCQPGDILYVRETWCKNPRYEEYYYAANRRKGASAPGGLKWRPSIHMPKEAARIWLKVTDVRVERLQDITEEEAKKEGFSCRNEFIQTFLKIYPECTEESWLWVIEFEQCEKPVEVAAGGEEGT